MNDTTITQNFEHMSLAELVRLQNELSQVLIPTDTRFTPVQTLSRHSPLTFTRVRRQTASKFGTEGRSMARKVPGSRPRTHVFDNSTHPAVLFLSTKKGVYFSYTCRAAKMNFSDRALHALSAGRPRLLRASGEPALLGKICQAIVEHGDYRAAWVSFAEQGDTKTLRPVAACGLEREAVASVQRSLMGASGQSTAARAPFGIGNPSVSRVHPADRSYESIREQACELRFGSASAFPRGFGVGERAAADARGRGRR